MVFFARKQTGEVGVVRAPRKYVDRKNDKIQAYQVRIHRRIRVTHEEDDHLNNTKPRNAEKRAERPPFGEEDEQHDPPQKHEHYEQPPKAFAGQTYPEQTERGGDPFPALELARSGEDMPDDDEQSAKIPHKIGHQHSRSREHVVLIEEIRDERGQTAFERVAKEGQHAHFQTEFAAHIHRAGVAAADLGNVLMFELGDHSREIETTDKIAYDGDDQKLPPVLRKVELLHKYCPLFSPRLSFL